MTDKELIAEISRTKISNRALVDAWFTCKDFDLDSVAATYPERVYLNKIQAIALLSGAQTFEMADYILKLEIRVKELEKRVEHISEFLVLD